MPETPYVFGRPTLYRNEFCNLLIEHLKKGFSFESFGAVAHCGKNTLYEWLKVHEDFKDAKRIGESYSRMKWEEIGMEGLHTTSGGDGVHANLNPTLWVFNMKNRFGWRNEPSEAEESKGKKTFTLKYDRKKVLKDKDSD